MNNKLQKLLLSLNKGLIGRDEVIRLTVLSMVAGENILLVGPPGTGKSMIARRLKDCLIADDNNENYFEYLLTKFSTPDEIFGPLSISELKQDRFKRNTQGYLPTVQIGFLDEIFKASSSILNSLLTILNERKFHNGAITEDVPLFCLIAASNELPTGQSELNALYDRFLIRVFVDYVSESDRAKFFEPIQYFNIPEEQKLSKKDLGQIREKANGVTVPAEIISLIQNIWKDHAEAFKEDATEQLSDRRLSKLIYLMKISAYTNNRNEVDLSDVFLLKNCLWNSPENAKQVNEIIFRNLKVTEQIIKSKKD